MSSDLALWQEVGSAFGAASESEAALLEICDSPDRRSLLLQHITSTLQRWWQDDPERIPRLLYRIDVPEARALMAFGSEQPIDALAEAILDRLQQTARSRLAYREEKRKSE